MTFIDTWYGSIVSMIIGMSLLIWGGNLLVEGGVAIAKRLGVSLLIIGLTIVAFSTSSPELALNVIASWNGNGELAFGNIIGSNIANIGLVLGIGALICKLPITGQIVRWEFPWLVTVTFIVGGIALLSSTDVVPSWLQGLGWPWAIVFLFLFCISMWKWFALGKSESVIAKQDKDVVPDNQRSAFASWMMLLGGLLLLGVGGKATELGAVSAAELIGIGQLVIGVTIVAIATSLPEVVTTIIAAKKGHPDLAVGNVVGSNLFNILFVLPITMLVHPVAIPNNAWVYIVVMLFITLLAWWMTIDARIKPKEGGLLIGLYVCFLIGVTIWAFRAVV